MSAHMLLRIGILFVLLIICIAPILLDRKLYVEGSASDDLDKYRKDNSHIPWKGPKTDVRINKMLSESITLMKELDVPISESICPEVTLTGSHSYYGRCCPKGSLKKYSEYEYYIEISGYTLQNTEKSLRNTLIHELIHTVPGGLCHTGEWKKWAMYVSQKTDYNIQRCDGDETEQDKERLRYHGHTKLF